MIYKSFYWVNGKPENNELQLLIPDDSPIRQRQVFEAWFHYYARELDADDYKRPIYDLDEIIAKWQVLNTSELTDLIYGESHITDDANLGFNIAKAILKCAPNLAGWVKTALHFTAGIPPAFDDLIDILNEYDGTPMLEAITDAVMDCMDDYKESREEREERIRGIVEEVNDRNEYILVNVPQIQFADDEQFLIKRVEPAFDDVAYEGEGPYYNPALRKQGNGYMNVLLLSNEIGEELQYSEEVTQLIEDKIGNDFAEIKEVQASFRLHPTVRGFLQDLHWLIDDRRIGENNAVYHDSKYVFRTLGSGAATTELLLLETEEDIFHGSWKQVWNELAEGIEVYWLDDDSFLIYDIGV